MSNKHKKPVYTLEFKQDAAKLVLKHGYTRQQAAESGDRPVFTSSRGLWAINDYMRTTLCVEALQMAFWRRKPKPGLLHHSDRGSQYASIEYRNHLEIMKMEQSMSRKGNCWDNSPTELFFVALDTSN